MMSVRASIGQQVNQYEALLYSKNGPKVYSIANLTHIVPYFVRILRSLKEET